MVTKLYGEGLNKGTHKIIWMTSHGQQELGQSTYTNARKIATHTKRNNPNTKVMIKSYNHLYEVVKGIRKDFVLVQIY